MIISVLLEGVLYSADQFEGKLLFSVDFDDRTVTPSLGSSATPVETGLMSFKPVIMGYGIELGKDSFSGPRTVEYLLDEPISWNSSTITFLIQPSQWTEGNNTMLFSAFASKSDNALRLYKGNKNEIGLWGRIGGKTGSTVLKPGKFSGPLLIGITLQAGKWTLTIIGKDGAVSESFKIESGEKDQKLDLVKLGYEKMHDPHDNELTIIDSFNIYNGITSGEALLDIYASIPIQNDGNDLFSKSKPVQDAKENPNRPLYWEHMTPELQELLKKTTAPETNHFSQSERRILKDVPKLFFQEDLLNFSKCVSYTAASGVSQTNLIRNFNRGVDVYLEHVDLPFYEGFDLKVNMDFDNRFQRILKDHPNAIFIIRTYFWNEKNFAQSFPDECFRFEDGTLGPYNSTRGATGYVDVNDARHSFASMIWLSQYGSCISRFISYLNTCPYADRIAGLYLGAGQAGEWVPWYQCDKEKGGAFDHSPAMKTAFRQYIENKYDSDEKLQKTWKMDGVVRSNPPIPSANMKRTTANDNNYDIHRDQQTIDYEECRKEMVDFMIEYLCRIVKQSSNGNLLAGAWAGYTADQCSNNNFRYMLESPYIDFFGSPIAYHGGAMGFSSAFRTTQTSYNLNGKVYLRENDVRTHVTRWSKDALNPPNEWLAKSQLVKEFANCLTSDISGYWYDMDATWYSPSVFDEIFRKFIEMERINAFLGDTNDHRVAIITDEGSQTVTDFDTVRIQQWFLKTHELYAMGTGGDSIDIMDIPKLKSGQYKVYIFINCYDLSAEKRKIAENLKRDNNVLVFLYGNGSLMTSDPDADSNKLLGEFTGIDFKKEAYPEGKICRMGIKPVPSKLRFDILKGNAVGQSFTIPKWQYAGTPRGEFLQTSDPWTCSFRWYVDDPSAEVLGVYDSSSTVKDAAAFVYKNHSSWHAFYFGSKLINSEVLRAINRFAGLHIFSDDNLFIYQNKYFLAVHAPESRTYTIRFPNLIDWYDPINETKSLFPSDNIELCLQKGESRLFFLGKKALYECLAEQAKDNPDGKKLEQLRIRWSESLDNCSIPETRKLEKLETYKLDKNGFIHHWLVLGCFPNPTRYDEKQNCLGCPAIDVDFLAEHGGQEKINPQEGMKHTTIFPVEKIDKDSLKRMFGNGDSGKPATVNPIWTAYNNTGSYISPRDDKLSGFFTYQDMCWYMCAYLIAQNEGDVELRFDSDKGYQLWVNEKLIDSNHTHAYPRGLDYHRKVVHLQKGGNRVLLKILQGIGGSKAAMRVMGLDGKPADGIKIILTPDDNH